MLFEDARHNLYDCAVKSHAMHSKTRRISNTFMVDIGRTISLFTTPLANPCRYHTSSRIAAKVISYDPAHVPNSYFLTSMFWTLFDMSQVARIFQLSAAQPVLPVFTPTDQRGYQQRMRRYAHTLRWVIGQLLELDIDQNREWEQIWYSF